MVSHFLDLFSHFIYSDFLVTICNTIFPFYLFYSAFSIIKYVVSR